jgi:hypothetical protein
LYYGIIVGALVYGVYFCIEKFKSSGDSGIFTADQLPQGQGSFFSSGKKDGYGDITGNATNKELGGMMDDEGSDDDAEEI